MIADGVFSSVRLGTTSAQDGSTLFVYFADHVMSVAGGRGRGATERVELQSGIFPCHAVLQEKAWYHYPKAIKH